MLYRNFNCKKNVNRRKNKEECRKKANYCPEEGSNELSVSAREQTVRRKRIGTKRKRPVRIKAEGDEK